MRQIALIVVLALVGSWVPAEAADIGLVDSIFTRIGAVDDLAGGRSTFMIEMLETAVVLRRATDRAWCCWTKSAGARAHSMAWRWPSILLRARLVRERLWPPTTTS
jgi:hypothetical protein